MNTFAPAPAILLQSAAIEFFFKSWVPLLIYVPANWPGQFSQIGWLGRASKLVTVKGHIGFEKINLMALLFTIIFISKMLFARLKILLE